MLPIRSHAVNWAKDDVLSITPMQFKSHALYLTHENLLEFSSANCHCVQDKCINVLLISAVVKLVA